MFHPKNKILNIDVILIFPFYLKLKRTQGDFKKMTNRNFPYRKIKTNTLNKIKARKQRALDPM